MPCCPKCKTEYREGFSLCYDCQCDLVEDLSLTADDEKSIDTEDTKQGIKPPLRILVPQQYRQSLLNVTAFFIVYMKCCEIFQEIGSKILSIYYTSIVAGLYALFLPIVLNMAYFAGAYAILNNRSVRSYFTGRNLAINTLITFAVNTVITLAYQGLFYQEISPELYNIIRLISIHQILEILALASIYVLTIKKVSLKHLLFNKMALCFYLIAILATIPQEIYNSYIANDFGIYATTDYLTMIMPLYLLWFGVMKSEKGEEHSFDLSNQEN